MPRPARVFVPLTVAGAIAAVLLTALPAQAAAPASAIAISRSTSHVAPGASETFTGALATAAGDVSITGEPVEIQQGAASGSSWTTLATVTTDADGAFSYTFSPSATAYYRAFFAGDANYGPRASRRTEVEVKAPVQATSITVDAVKAAPGGTISYGAPVVIRGHASASLVGQKLHSFAKAGGWGPTLTSLMAGAIVQPDGSFQIHAKVKGGPGPTSFVVRFAGTPTLHSASGLEVANVGWSIGASGIGPVRLGESAKTAWSALKPSMDMNGRTTGCSVGGVAQGDAFENVFPLLGVDVTQKGVVRMVTSGTDSAPKGLNSADSPRTARGVRLGTSLTTLRRAYPTLRSEGGYEGDQLDAYAVALGHSRYLDVVVDQAARVVDMITVSSSPKLPAKVCG